MSSVNKEYCINEQYKDADFLKQKLIDEGLSTKELAEHCFCSESTIYYWVVRALYKKYPELKDVFRLRSTRYREFDWEKYKEIKKLRNEHYMPVRKIAEKYGVTPQTIRDTLKKGKRLEESNHE